MPIYIPPARARQIAVLSIELECTRNAVAALAEHVEQIAARLDHLTRDRNRAMTRGALDILRRSGQPMGLRALTVALMADKGLDTADRALVGRTMEKLRVSLTRQAAAGIVRREKGLGLTMVWSVAQ